MKINLDKAFPMPKMRSKDEMLGLILATALEDERIRAVILNGSRANPNAVPDRFQDYDVVYVVIDEEPFVDDPRWIDRFGERMILQTPTLMADPPPDPSDHFAYLMQFSDGNRIDLTLVPVEQVSALKEDRLSILLLDKDGRFPPFPPPSEASYFPQPPTAKTFADCCNEFWWVSPYVAKALARGEILYAHHVFESALRQQLMKMLTWLFGIKTDFNRNPGKAGNHFNAVFSPKHWEMLLGTFSTAEVDATWNALYMMGALFRECAQDVAQSFGFLYPTEDDRRVSQYLQSIYESTLKDESKRIEHSMIDLIQETALKILRQSPDVVIRHKLKFEILCQHGNAQDVFSLDASQHVETLANEQHDDGSWGRFHSQDSRRKQKIPTTEFAVERALHLGLGPTHPILLKTANFIEHVLNQTLPFPDPPETNNR